MTLIYPHEDDFLPLDWMAAPRSSSPPFALAGSREHQGKEGRHQWQGAMPRVGGAAPRTGGGGGLGWRVAAWGGKGEGGGGWPRV